MRHQLTWQMTGWSTWFRSTAAWLLAVIAFPTCANAQLEPTDPGTYALMNGRIVVSPEEVIEQGSVILRDGRITAVGEQVEVPTDALRMNVDGLTVYPGLIDAANSSLLPWIPPAEHGDPEPSDVRPTRKAIREFGRDEAALMELRAAGVTVVGLAWEGGIVPGKAGAVLLTSPPAILAQETALQVAFGTRQDIYPISLMGTLAWLRQAFLDAARYRKFATEYRAGRLTWDLTLQKPDIAPLGAATDGELRVWFTAHDENDILRALDLAEATGLKGAILGGQEAHRTLRRLASQDWPVLLSLAFPNPDSATGWSYVFGENMPQEGPARAAAIADSVISTELRHAPVALLDEGVPFALTSFALNSATELFSRIEELRGHGLPSREILRALTLTPARILGLEHLLGTIDSGKLGNLVVVEGDLFDDGVIRHVFVDGIRYDCGYAESAAGDLGCWRPY